MKKYTSSYVFNGPYKTKDIICWDRIFVGSNTLVFGISVCTNANSAFECTQHNCSEMASLSDVTSGQSKNLKKVSKLLERALQITYFILMSVSKKLGQSTVVIHYGSLS